MRLVIITKTVPPENCGIADHTILLAQALRVEGHKVVILAGEGGEANDIVIAKRFWEEKKLKTLESFLIDLNPDKIILQYTPLMYPVNLWHHTPHLTDFWARCASRCSTVLIAHETFFRAWWHPPSWVKGFVERSQMKRLVSTSNNVYTASEPLYKSIRNWPGNFDIHLLPISSNIKLVNTCRNDQRNRFRIEKDEIVLTLFSGGAGLLKCKNFVNEVDSLMRKNNVTVRWLLLGGVKPECFVLRSAVLSPGYLPSDELSAYLQMTDIFLMPHISGLSAKRGTLMTALQHGLPVIGTDGVMTDSFWRLIPGVKLIPFSGAKNFANAVYELAKNPVAREDMGQKNSYYFKNNLTWEKIAQILLKDLK